MNNVEIGLCFTLTVKMNKITANSLSPTCHGDEKQYLQQHERNKLLRLHFIFSKEAFNC